MSLPLNLRKFLVAPVTRIGLLSGMGSPMHIEIIAVSEYLVALVTAVRFLAGMSAHVFLKTVFLDETCRTIRTSVRLLSGMSTNVTSELTRSNKFVSALRARKTFHAIMSEQVPCTGLRSFGILFGNIRKENFELICEKEIAYFF